MLGARNGQVENLTLEQVGTTYTQHLEICIICCLPLTEPKIISLYIMVGNIILGAHICDGLLSSCRLPPRDSKSSLI